jgi:hypothetical protein
MRPSFPYLACLLLAWALALPAEASNPQELKKKLCRSWRYQKCRVLGVEYAPKPSERHDSFELRPDMTFRLVEEGVAREGVWELAPGSDTQVLLTFASGSQQALRIDALDAGRFVYTVAVDWQHEVTVYLETAPPAAVPYSLHEAQEAPRWNTLGL